MYQIASALFPLCGNTFWHPSFAFLVVSAVCPSAYDVVYQIVSSYFNLAVWTRFIIIAPSLYYRVQSSNQGNLWSGTIFTCYRFHFFQQVFDRLVRWFDYQFTIVFLEVIAQEIESLTYMGNLRFLIRERQSPFCKKFFYGGLDFLFQNLLIFACNDEVVSIFDNVYFGIVVVFAHSDLEPFG